MTGSVLIADGQPERAQRVSEACSVRGLGTRIVRNGAEALEAALESVPDVLVADAALGVIEVSKLADILRANPRTQGVQLVMVGTPPQELDDDTTAPHFLGSHPEEIARRVETLLGGDPGPAPESGPDSGAEEVQGQVAQIPLPDLLQLFHLNRRSGTIELRRRGRDGRKSRGRIHLRDGDVVHSVAGPVEGEKALYRLFAWTEGSFAFRPERVTLPMRIQTPTRALLLEGLRQLDEWRRSRASLPPLDAQVTLRVKSAELPNVVHPLTQEVLLLLDIYSRVRDVVDHCSFPDYQVLRTLQTLEARGIVELRATPPPPAPDRELFTEAQVRRLREWMTPARASAPGHAAKLLLLASEPSDAKAFLDRLAPLPGLRLEPRVRERGVPLGPVTRVGVLQVDTDLSIELLHVPADATLAPLWPLAGYGALGVLALLCGPVAEAEARLRPALGVFRSLPRARIFHVLLVGKGETALPDEVRDNLSLLEEGSLFLLPPEGGKQPATLLRSVLSRILP